MADPSMSGAALPAGGNLAIAAEAHDAPLRALFPEALQHNARQISFIRSIGLSVAGGIAGVLGLSNLSGFYFYLLSQALLSLLVVALNAHAQPAQYLPDAAVLALQAQRARVAKAAAQAPGSAPGAGLGDAASTRSIQPPGPLAAVWAWTKIVLLDGVQENLLSYILWWTLWYGVVHVYD